MKTLNKNIRALTIHSACVSAAALDSGDGATIAAADTGVIVVHNSKMTARQLFKTIQSLTDYKEELFEQLLSHYDNYAAEFGVCVACEEDYPRGYDCNRDCKNCGFEPEECDFHDDESDPDPAYDFYMAYQNLDRAMNGICPEFLHPKLFRDLVSEGVCLSTFADMLDENEIAYE